MTRKSLFSLWCVLSLVLITAASVFAYAKTPNLSPQSGTEVGPTPRITQAIDPRAYVSLHGNTRPEAKNAIGYKGALESTYPVEHILLFLQRSPEQEKALDRLIEELNDRNSPNFHKWLTADEFGQRFGVDESDIQQVTNWLESQGFVVNQVYPNRMVLDISGTAGAIQQALHTKMGKLVVDGETHIANMSDPQIPAALAPVIKGFASLNDFRPHAMNKPVTQYTFAGCTSSTAHPIEPGTCYAMTPQDTQTIYNLTPLYTAGYSGQGQTIYLIEDSDSYGSDWQTYRTAFGLSTAYPAGNLTTLHPLSCTDPGAIADDGEADIDVEVATSVAPSANIVLASCTSGTVTFGGLIALQNLINESSPTKGVVSISYGVCEVANGNGGNAAFYNTYQQAAALGFSVFVSSGDEGSSSCSRNFTTIGNEYYVTSLGVTGWGSTPYNVSVGGTDFEDVYNAKTGQNGGAALSTYWNSTNSSDYGSAKSYIPEIPWNDACASTLITFAIKSNYTTYGSSGFCNTSPGNSTSGYLSTGAASGGASNCATGSGGSNSSSYLISEPQCQGWAKPTYQTGSALSGGKAVYGMPSDGVRDIPDVSLFASNGAWGHYETVCWSDPSYTSVGAASCSGAPSTWSGFGGTSISTPTMAAIQALVNQKTGEYWGNPLSYYYQMGQNEYGTAGGTFQGSGCNSSTGSGSSCVFNDVTQGDIDAACENNGTLEEAHCYTPSGTYGVASTDVITAATVINGGSGYTTAPTCTIAGPTNNSPYKSPTGTTLWAGGTQATCTATVSSSSTTATWTVAILSTTAAGMTIQLANPAGTTTCGPYTLSGTSASNIAANLVTSATGCSLINTPTRSSSTVTLTAKTTGYAGDFNVSFGNNGDLYEQGYVTITNTILGQGPNYVSGITITAGGSGYQPETPITLGGPGSGAIAVANTSIGTAAASYQPAYGAAPGYDLATGLGSPNAYNFVCSSVWGSTCVTTQPTTTTVSSNSNPSTYGGSVTFTATVTSGSNPVTSGTVQFVIDGTNYGSPVALNGSGQATATPVNSLNAGSHTVQANYSGTSSYNSSTGSLNQIVNAAVLTVTASNASDTYGGPLPTLTYTMTGFVLGQNQGTATTGSPSESTTATANSNVGTYPISISQGNLAANNNNYTFTFVNGTFTVNAAVLTVTATNASDTYGGPLPTLTYTMTGFVLGQNQGTATTGSPSETTTATVNSNVGTYAISVSQGTLAANNNNYTFSFVNGTFTVNPAVLSVTANNTAITYGCNCSPVLSYTMTGFVLGQNQGTATTGAPNETTTGTQGAAGTYPIVISQGTLAANNNNYTFTFANGVLTVNQAPLTVTANNATIVAYSNLPTFTASYSGFVNGDNQSNLTGAPAFSTDASQNPPEGSYTIYVTQGTLADPNYSFTFVNGTLTVTAAVAQIQSPPKNTMLGGSTAMFNWSQESNAVSYTLNLGSTPAGSDLGTVTTSNLTATFNGLPTDGSYIYATLLGSTDGTNYTQQDTGVYVANGPIAVMVNPLPNTILSGASVTFTWVPGAQSSAYWVDIGPNPGGNQYEQSGNLGNQTSLTVNNLPTNGSPVYVTLWSYTNGQWVYNEYQYSAYGAGLIATMASPTPGSTLSGSSQLFTWNAGSGSSAYWIDAGSTQGGNQYFQSGNLGNQLSDTVSNLPTDGSTVYITLWSLVNGQWLYNEYTYTAYSVSSGAGQITSPTPGTTLPGSTVTFNWSAGSQSTSYWLDVGSSPGGNQYFQSGPLGSNTLQATVNGLPTDGSTVYVTLYSLINGQWIANAYTYTAYSPTNGLAVMQTPNPGTEIDGTQATFTWSAGTNASGYWLDLGSTPGGNDIYQSGDLGLALNTTVYTLPNNGTEIYATLYTLINGQWYYNSYQYQSGPSQSKPAQQKLKMR